ncbi:hypothetical protein MMC07_004293 [Pseudocyphellaria aurata]|nr:hypothetical protein [Pseudocyphellaria aurata]
MFFLRAFATVLFLFGSSIIVPGFVDGLAIAYPRMSLSAETAKWSDTIFERHLNDDDHEADVAAIIPRAVSSGAYRNTQPKQGVSPGAVRTKPKDKPDDRGDNSQTESTGNGRDSNGDHQNDPKDNESSSDYHPPEDGC